jgi:putative ABC transport system permease protein
MNLATMDMRRHFGKFVAATIGVGLLLAIVLIMNGIYQGNVADGVWLIDNTGSQLWVVENGRGGPFNEQSRMPQDSYRSVAAIPGVAKAAPFITYNVQRQVGDRERQFTIIGYDVFDGLGGPRRLVAGRPIERGHYQAVADVKLGLKPGQKLQLGRHEYTIVGLIKGGVDSSGSPLLYLSLPDAQEVLYDLDNEALLLSRAATLKRLQAAGVGPEEARRLLPLFESPSRTINAVLVHLTPGADPAAVAKHIRQWLHYNVYSNAQERKLLIEGKLKKMGTVLKLFRSLLIIVAVVIISLLIYVLTIEKLKSIATLKLMGAANRVIISLILQQSMVVTLGAFALGYVFAQFAYPHFPRTLVILPQETFITFLIILAGGILASTLGIVQALRTPARLALGG